jgi:hypothetical protein
MQTSPANRFVQHVLLVSTPLWMVQHLVSPVPLVHTLQRMAKCLVLLALLANTHLLIQHIAHIAPLVLIRHYRVQLLATAVFRDTRPQRGQHHAIFVLLERFLGPS